MIEYEYRLFIRTDCEVGDAELSIYSQHYSRNCSSSIRIIDLQKAKIESNQSRDGLLCKMRLGHIRSTRKKKTVIHDANTKQHSNRLR